MSDCRVRKKATDIMHPKCLNGLERVYCYAIGDYRLCRECWPCAECDPCADCDTYPCPYAEVDDA